MKLERILAIAGLILLLVITIAIINTYTDLFKEVFKEDKPAASVEEKPLNSPKPKDGNMDFGRENSGKKVSGGSAENKEKDDAPKEIVRERKIGRNDKCPCGSGKKYKHCCGSV